MDPSAGLSGVADLFSKTSTFVSIDVVDSTSLKSGENEQDVIYTFLTYHKMVRELAYTHHGEIATISGDGMMCRFERADDAAAAVRPFLEKEKVEYLTLMADSDIQSVYRVRAIPTFVLIDARGFIAKIYQGFAPEMEVEWEKQINRLLPN